MGPLRIFVNTTANDTKKAIVASYISNNDADAVILSVVDRARPVEVHLLEELPPGGDPQFPFKYLDPTGLTVNLAFGRVSLPTTGGTWKFADSHAGQTTAAIDYNASAASVQAAIRAACTTNFGSCNVSGNNGGPWTIDRGVNGAYIYDPSGDTSSTIPANSFLSVINTRDGNVNRSEEWTIQLFQPAAALASLSGTYLPAAAANAHNDQSGSAGVNARQTVTWNTDAYAGFIGIQLNLPAATIGTGGASVANPCVITTQAAHLLRTGDSVTIANNSISGLNGTSTATVLSPTTFSVPFDNHAGSAGNGGSVTVTRGISVPYNVTADDFVTALVSHGVTLAVADNFTVVKNGTGSYTVTFQGGLGSTAIPTMSVTAAISVPVGLKGTINCQTEGVVKLLNGSPSDQTARLEVELVDGDLIPRIIGVRDDALLRPTLFPPGLISSDPLSTNVLYDPSSGRWVSPVAPSVSKVDSTFPPAGTYDFDPELQFTLPASTVAEGEAFIAFSGFGSIGLFGPTPHDFDGCKVNAYFELSHNDEVLTELSSFAFVDLTANGLYVNVLNFPSGSVDDPNYVLHITFRVSNDNQGPRQFGIGVAAESTSSMSIGEGSSLSWMLRS